MNHSKSIMRLFGYVIVVISIVAVGTAFAAESTPEKPAEMATQAETAQPAEAAMPAEMATAADISITGIVEKSDSGLQIKAADANYFVMGQDLSSMVGKTVTATGTLDEGKEGKTLNVLTCKEVAQ